MEWLEYLKVSLDVAKKLSRAARYMGSHTADGDKDYDEASFEYYDAYDWLEMKAKSCGINFLDLRAAALEMRDFSTPSEWHNALKKRNIDFFPDFVDVTKINMSA